MDATVNDFLNEIDQIVPLEKKNQCAWQECFDDNTGYSYYWNVNTDQVTWEMPDEYKKWLKTNEKTSVKPSFNSRAKPAPLFPSTSLPVSADSIKIYKIESEAKIDKPNGKKTPKSNKTSKEVVKSQKSSDSEDEKIVLISSYGGDTDSEDEKEEGIKLNSPKSDLQKNTSKSSPHSNKSEDANDEDILSQIQNQAKLLQKLGGELPPDVKNLVEPTKSKETKEISGFSLLAAYGDSDEENEKNEDHSPQLFPTVTAVESKISHSTLFPIREPIDVKQFSEGPKPENTTEDAEIDKKPFQRKRRIGIDLPNTRKRPKNDQQDLTVTNETVGLGFNKSAVEYSGFKSGGIMFVKSDVLNPIDSEDSKDSITKDKDADSKKKSNKTVEKTMTTLSEKLKFLSEGRSPVSPVQIMIIQLETLDMALKAGGLSVDYLEKYLNEVHSDLAKLEKEATPQGWLLQWDRLNKRYYYQNEVTGESQWEYPQTDIIGGDVAMDISMTPPRGDNEDTQESVPSPVVTPPPPRIKDPTPPPPPKISTSKTNLRRKETDPPLPPPEVAIPLPPLPPGNGSNEPLPPGVEINEVTSSKGNGSPQHDSLNTALSSFYSDLAAIENNSPTNPTSTEETVNVLSPTPNLALTTEPIKKKKKTKVKLTQGLAMKKKGVSKLVEKWKNVQKNYL